MMNIFKRYLLKTKLRVFMRKYAALENLQTEHSDDEQFYHYLQHKMDALDEKAERIREILEGRWNCDV